MVKLLDSIRYVYYSIILLTEQTDKLKSELFDHITPVKQFYNLINQSGEVV
jgi:hypothetical protein